VLDWFTFSVCVVLKDLDDVVLDRKELTKGRIFIVEDSEFVDSEIDVISGVNMVGLINAVVSIGTKSAISMDVNFWKFGK
jgi:hypothetical protein